MAKIAFIGAGSVVFTRNLVNDLLSFDALEECTISLMDIDTMRLDRAAQLVAKMIVERGLRAHVEATNDRRDALRDARYVVVTVQVGGLQAYEQDITIPATYGVGQCVGDTLGPGGVFRGLRTIPLLLDVCAEMDELCPPDALLINYSNPMAINCWAIADGSGRPHVGLCHSVQGTTELLAQWANAPYEQVRYESAGINHQAWILSLTQQGHDLYPRVRAAVKDPQIRGSEPVRIELMEQFGYFVTESSGHASEYSPYFRKNPAAIEELSARFTSSTDSWFDWGRTGGYLRECRRRLPTYLDEINEQIAGRLPLPRTRTHEYGAAIVNAIETDEALTVYGNVPNSGLITNLPQGCCVEVACLVKGTGIHPTVVGDLPPQLAGLNRTNINVQELAVYGSLHGDREAIVHAIMLDPLTASVCTPDQVRAMVSDMFTAQAQWLPQFPL